MISVSIPLCRSQIATKLLGWDLGSVEVLGENVTAEDSTGVLAGTKIVLNTDVGKGAISKNWSTRVSRVLHGLGIYQGRNQRTSQT